MICCRWASGSAWARIDVVTTVAKAMTLTALAVFATMPLAPSLDADFDTALGMATLSTATARFDKGILSFYRQSDGPTTFYQACYDDPWRIPFFADMQRKQLALGFGQPSVAIENGSRMIGQGSRRSLLGDPAKSALDKAKGPNPLAAAIEAFKQAGLIKSEPSNLSQIPRDVQQAAAVVMFAALESLDYRRASLSSIADVGAAFTLCSENRGEPSGPLEEKRRRSLQSAVTMTTMYAAGQNLGAAVNGATTLARLVPSTSVYDFKLDTDWGKIVLSGGKANTHDGTATLLVIDTSGDDTYVNAPSTSSASNWLSVTIDTAGNDKYVSDPALLKTKVADWTLRTQQKGLGGPCSALLGFAFLMDESGDDLYRTARPGLGSAVFGVAYLGDRAGKDEYDAYRDAEGFGHYGLGILDDSDGDDTYRGFTQVQGVGLPHGAGLLLDKTGNDVYDANDTVLDFPSAQTADHNNSMAQGAGYGFRADYLTGNSQSGGIGLLFDQSGDDRYTCGVFGQGVGYWDGVGLLWDLAGKDAYLGQWYVQGAAAHFGIGFLEDGAGDDDYQALLNMAQGAGHDFSVGMLLDRGGNDSHKAPNLSLGAGNANGIGIAVDLVGNDIYNSSGLSLGNSAEAQKSSLRERALSLGLFMDLGGGDTYPEAFSWAKNNTRSANWNFKAEKPNESQVGVFLDR